MIELIIVGVFYIVLALTVCYRLIKGPSVVDRAVASDSVDILVTAALILFTLYSNRSIYLDIAMISALLGILDTLLTSRYLEGRL
jgi:multisubunit Na+/H+ antiporter MnhF subunit